MSRVVSKIETKSKHFNNFVKIIFIFLKVKLTKQKTKQKSLNFNKKTDKKLIFNNKIVHKYLVVYMYAVN